VLPLRPTMEEQREIEGFLSAHPERRLLNLLTLRGDSGWVELRDRVSRGEIGVPAFVHVRMAVQLRADTRPAWFLDVSRSGGLFLDLLIHGLDQVEYLTGSHVTALTANMGNLGKPAQTSLRDHAAVYCELDNGGGAVVEGQRMLPATKGSDYRVTVAGTKGYADLVMSPRSLLVTNEDGADMAVQDFPDGMSVVADWLAGGDLVSQQASLRANLLAVLATESALTRTRVEVPLD